MRTSRTILVRVAAGAVLFMCLAGPGAGNVGGCGNSPPLADPVMHCMARQDVTCRRELVAERIDTTEYAECVGLIEATCMGASWPVGCEPTPAASDRCITLLGRLDLLPIPTDQLLAMYPDCNLCM